MVADDPFGAHGGSAGPAERSAKAKLSSKIAIGLSAEAAPEKPKRHGSEQRKVPSGLSQEELQCKIEWLMGNPKLWQKNSNSISPRQMSREVRVRKKALQLREFIEHNAEIAAEDAAIQEEQATKRYSGLG